ncbi:MAG: hypothetical protein ACJ76H_09335 [Bacteriovoracaceae bacterium]
MRKTEMAVVAFALFLFVLAGPLTAQKEIRQDDVVRQEQQAEAEEFIAGPGESYKVVFRAGNNREDSVADILWLKKAAEVAIDAGIPHFNVTKKKQTREFNRNVHRRLNVVEGVIELDNDPMKAEYDANEILSLVLPEFPR